MERVLQELKNYSRWLQLEVKIPDLEEALAEAKDFRIGADGNVRVAQWEMERLEKPGFFQRLKGDLEDRKEEVRRQMRTAQTQLQQAQEEEELRRKALEDARAEFTELSGSWNTYLQEKERFGQTVEGEKELLTGICMGLTKDCQEALEQARPWMRQDTLRRGVSFENRKLEFLALAADRAVRINAILEQLPEDAVEKPAYLRNPEGYVTGYTMEFKQLDQVNNAIEQIWDLRQKLKAL